MMLNNSSLFDEGLYERRNGGSSLESHTIQRIVTLAGLILVALVGNTTVLCVLTCNNVARRRNRRVNIFVLNLAIGDLVVCFITMPTEIVWYVRDDWILGSFGCKFVAYIQVATIASTIFLLIVMSYDRYQAIAKPLHFSNAIRNAKVMVVCAWMLAAILAIPQIFIFDTTTVEDNGLFYLKCKSDGYTSDWQRRVYFGWFTTYILVIPTCLISFCYIQIIITVWRHGRSSGDAPQLRCTGSANISRAKVKTIKMTLCIIISFVMCWAPYFIVTNIEVFSSFRRIEPIWAFSETLALANSAVNPVLYSCFNLKLQKLMCRIFCPATWLLRKKSKSSRYTSKKTQSTSLTMSIYNNSTRTFSRNHRNKLATYPNPSVASTTVNVTTVIGPSEPSPVLTHHKNTVARLHGANDTNCNESNL